MLRVLPSKLKAAISLVALLLVPFGYANAVDGNRDHQEVGDVVFRKLGIPGFENVHSAIYKGYVRNYVEDQPLMDYDYYQDVIEMGGLGGTRPCLVIEGGHSEWSLCVKNWLPIRTMDLHAFKRANPPYFGAFSSHAPEDNTKEIRANVVETATRLMKRDNQVVYVVVEDQPVSRVFDNYFEYIKVGGSNAIGLDQVVRMRSDAFVEYCYAAAGMPIMPYLPSTPYDITTVTGADALIGMSAQGNLFPSYQRDRLQSSAVTQPIIEVLNTTNHTTVLEGSRVKLGSLLDISVKDSNSGPAKLQRRFYNNVVEREVYRPFETGATLNRETSYSFSKDFNKLSSGLTKFRAYDFGGNYSELSFNIADDPKTSIHSFGPLYSEFKGISAINPSTLERSHTLEFSDDTAGISSVIIDGPQGNIWTQTFDPPVPSTSAVLSDLPLGNYTVKSFNSVGGETKTPFIRNFIKSLVV